MPRPCRSPAMPCCVNSHMPCHAPAILRQFRVLRANQRGGRKYPNCWSCSLTDWYASVNNLRGTPRRSRKKPNVDRSHTCMRRNVKINVWGGMWKLVYETECENWCMRRNVKINVWVGLWKFIYETECENLCMRTVKINVWDGMWKFIYVEKCEN
jgi:hypothetical protein